MRTLSIIDRSRQDFKTALDGLPPSKSSSHQRLSTLSLTTSSLSLVQITTHPLFIRASELISTHNVKLAVQFARQITSEIPLASLLLAAQLRAPLLDCSAVNVTSSFPVYAVAVRDRRLATACAALVACSGYQFLCQGRRLLARFGLCWSSTGSVDNRRCPVAVGTVVTLMTVAGAAGALAVSAFGLGIQVMPGSTSRVAPPGVAERVDFENWLTSGFVSRNPSDFRLILCYLTKLWPMSHIVRHIITISS